MRLGKRGLLFALAGLALGGAALSAYTLSRPRPEAADVKVIAHGDEVDLADHLARGKYTIIDFYAVWCPPCRVLSPALERLAERHPGELAIRKVDIVDWTMPVAAQHGIESLPHLLLFDRQGRRLASGEEVFDVLERLFGEAAREVSEITAVERQSRIE